MISRHVYRVKFCIAVVALACSPLAAQESPPGRYDYNVRYWVQPLKRADMDRALPPATATLFVSRVQQLMTALEAHPLIKSPPPERCYAVSASLSGQQPAAPEPVRAEVSVALHWWVRAACGFGLHSLVGAVAIAINQPEAALGPSRPDAEGKFYPFKGEISHGPIARYQTHTVLTRRTEPLLVPLTKQRYLTYLIAEMQKKVDGTTASEQSLASSRPPPTMAELYARWLNEGKPQMQATVEQSVKTMRELGKSASEIADTRAQLEASIVAMEETWQKNVAQERATPRPADPRPAVQAGLGKRKQQESDELESLRAQLAALSPGERAAPACSAPRVRAMYPEISCNDGWQLVVVNPKFFDSSLPRGEVQLLVIKSPSVSRASEWWPLWQAMRDGAGLESVLR